MLRTFLLTAALLGASSVAYAEPELRSASKYTVSKVAGASKKVSEDGERSHPGAIEDVTRTVRVDDVDVTVPLLKGYRDLSGLPDAYRSMFERMVPDEMVFLDFHLHESADVMDIHSLSPNAHYEIYVAKALKSKRVSPKEWGEYGRGLLAVLKTEDMTQLLMRNETRINAALDEHGVTALRVDALRAGTPVIYRFDDRSLRMLMVVSNEQTIEGKAYQIEEVRAMANLFVKGKIVTIVASREFRAGSAKPPEVVAALDAFADRMLALNP